MNPVTPVNRTTLHRMLAAFALAAGLLAAAVSSPTPKSAPADLAQLAQIAARIEHEEDHVTALEVAEWIRDRRPRLRLVDLRPPTEYAAGHLPTAENRSLGELLATGVGAQETVVLYSAGGTHAAQGWVLLAARGARAIYTLAGGYDAWLREVMHPELPRNASAAAAAAFARTSELSRYFGGRPRIVDAVSPSTGEVSAEELAAQAARARRGGC